MARYGISSYGASTGLSGAEIKNLALGALGFTDEVDFSDLTNETVKKVNRVYPTTLSFVLSNYPWRFIMKRIQLTSRTDAVAGIAKYKYNYLLPANLLAIRTLYSDKNYNCQISEFDSTPQFINTDSPTVYLWYTALVDEERFPQYFIDYFKYKLAMDLCFLLTGDMDLLKVLAAQEARGIMTAKNIDAKQNKVRQIRRSPFISIRR